MGPDPKCLELAEHILRTHPEYMRERAIDLAYAIQAAADEWLDRERQPEE